MHVSGLQTAPKFDRVQVKMHERTCKLGAMDYDDAECGGRVVECKTEQPHHHKDTNSGSLLRGERRRLLRRPAIASLALFTKDFRRRRAASELIHQDPQNPPRKTDAENYFLFYSNILFSVTVPQAWHDLSFN